MPSQGRIQDFHWVGPGGGGGHLHIEGDGDVPLDRVWFCGHQYWHRVSCGPLAVINIGKWYLNRPNWLLAGYSVYHRVASQGFPARFSAHNVYDRPAIWAPATVQYCDMVCIWTFLVRYCDRVYFVCTERFATGSGFRPPAAPPSTWKSSAPPPPPGSGGGGRAGARDYACTHITNSKSEVP